MFGQIILKVITIYLSIFVFFFYLLFITNFLKNKLKNKQTSVIRPVWIKLIAYLDTKMLIKFG